MKSYARVKSPHFDAVFNCKNTYFDEKDLENMFSKYIDIKDMEKRNPTNKDKYEVVKMLDFVVSSAKILGITGSQLFSMYLEKEKFTLCKCGKNETNCLSKKCYE